MRPKSFMELYHCFFWLQEVAPNYRNDNLFHHPCFFWLLPYPENDKTSGMKRNILLLLQDIWPKQILAFVKLVFWAITPEILEKSNLRAQKSTIFVMSAQSYTYSLFDSVVNIFINFSAKERSFHKVPSLYLYFGVRHFGYNGNLAYLNLGAFNWINFKKLLKKSPRHDSICTHFGNSHTAECYDTL